MRPFLFEIDGPEYAGKTTTLKKLESTYFNLVNDNFKFFYGTGTSELSDRLRPIIKEVKMTAEESCGLLYANNCAFINSILQSGYNAFTDRGLVSYFIYQGYLANALNDCKGVFSTLLGNLVNFYEENFRYYRIILSLSPETVIKRKAKRDQLENNSKDQFDNMDLFGHRTLCSYYDGLHGVVASQFFDQSKTIILDCEGLSEELVAQKIYGIVNEIVESWKR